MIFSQTVCSSLMSLDPGSPHLPFGPFCVVQTQSPSGKVDLRLTYYPIGKQEWELGGGTSLPLII